MKEGGGFVEGSKKCKRSKFIIPEQIVQSQQPIQVIREIHHQCFLTWKFEGRVMVMETKGLIRMEHFDRDLTIGSNHYKLICVKVEKPNGHGGFCKAHSYTTAYFKIYYLAVSGENLDEIDVAEELKR